MQSSEELFSRKLKALNGSMGHPASNTQSKLEAGGKANGNPSMPKMGVRARVTDRPLKKEGWDGRGGSLITAFQNGLPEQSVEVADLGEAPLELDYSEQKYSLSDLLSRSPLKGLHPIRQRSNSDVTISDIDAEDIMDQNAINPNTGASLHREYGSTSSIDRQGLGNDGFFSMLRGYRIDNSEHRSNPPVGFPELLRYDTTLSPSLQTAAQIARGEIVHISGYDCVDSSFLYSRERDKSFMRRLKSEQSETSLFRKLRTIKSESDALRLSTEEGDRRPYSFQKCFAHYDVQSVLFNISEAVASRISLSQRKNTTTGASAASQYQIPGGGQVAGNVPGLVSMFDSPLGSREDLNPKENLDADEGDGKSNKLVYNCPHFRNEIGGEGERRISLSRSNSATYSTGGENCSFESSLSSHCTNAGVSVLEVPRESQAIHREKVKRYIIEHIDLGAYYYHKYFYGKEHQNYFGVDENLGPVAISIRREKLDEGKDKDTAQYNYRITFRTSQLSTLRGSILEDAVPSSARHGTARGLPLKELLEYVLPELNIQCLRLALSSPRVPEQLLKLDEQGLSFQHKVGVLYCKSSQSTEEEMYNNEEAGPALEEFLDLLGQRVRLKGFSKYRAQLDNKTDSTGTHSLYTTYKDYELMFHVSTLLPYTPNNRQQLLRKRHIGNDIVTIVFQEPGALPFTPKNIRSHFQHVFVIVKVHNPCTENVCYRLPTQKSITVQKAITDTLKQESKTEQEISERIGYSQSAVSRRLSGKSVGRTRGAAFPRSSQKQRQKHLTWATEKQHWTVAQILQVIRKSRSQSLEEDWEEGNAKMPEGRVNAATHQEILENFMLPSAEKLCGDEDFVFQHDLAPAHTAKTTGKWFTANSPDLNPKENLWDIVKGKLRDARPNTLDELKAAFEASWASITPQQCHRLIASAPRRIELVISAKGFPTNVAVSRSKDVPPFGPPIPKGVTFPKSAVFRDFLLAKVINGENAAHKSEKFRAMATRTRQEYLKDLAENFVSTTTVDSAVKFSFITLGAKKKERVKPRKDAHLQSMGAVTWCVVARDFGQSMDVECLLGISNEFIVLVEEESKNVIFNCSCRDVIGWSSGVMSIKVFYERGECVMVSAHDNCSEDIREVVQRLEFVTRGCETTEMTLRRNGLGQLGFHVNFEGIVADVEPYGFAWKAGLRQGSRLVEICKVAVATLTHEQMIDLLRTSITVKVLIIQPFQDGAPRRGCSELYRIPMVEYKLDSEGTPCEYKTPFKRNTTWHRVSGSGQQCQPHTQQRERDREQEREHASGAIPRSTSFDRKLPDAHGVCVSSGSKVEASQHYRSSPSNQSSSSDPGPAGSARCQSPLLHERSSEAQCMLGDGEILREREPTLERTRSAEAKWHVPSTKILNSLKERGKDSPNKSRLQGVDKNSSASSSNTLSSSGSSTHGDEKPFGSGDLMDPEILGLTYIAGASTDSGIDTNPGVSGAPVSRLTIAGRGASDQGHVWTPEMAEEEGEPDEGEHRRFLHQSYGAVLAVGHKPAEGSMGDLSQTSYSSGSHHSGSPLPHRFKLPSNPESPGAQESQPNIDLHTHRPNKRRDDSLSSDEPPYQSERGQLYSSESTCRGLNVGLKRNLSKEEYIKASAAGTLSPRRSLYRTLSDESVCSSNKKGSSHASSHSSMLDQAVPNDILFSSTAPYHSTLPSRINASQNTSNLKNEFWFSDGSLAERCKFSDPGLIPLPDADTGLDWSHLVDAARAFEDQRVASFCTMTELQRAEALQISRELSRCVANTEAEERDGSPASHTLTGKVNQLEVILRQLQYDLKKEKEDKAILQVEVQHLRQDNMRLQEESQSAAAQLRKFTEWLLHTVDKTN
ncbi:hypothetical protein DNTS_029568 [Danionella cerebrum]|uniref:Signal-induced proliferation-associated 1-like protein 2 n=1 Tax=Danionella cerebrum TaxID=2873325 RepID=A0A553QS10_9TELE|nr:hypothetical protein DNTS_029568 [Danionella translucida]